MGVELSRSSFSVLPACGGGTVYVYVLFQQSPKVASYRQPLALHITIFSTFVGGINPAICRTIPLISAMNTNL